MIEHHFTSYNVRPHSIVNELENLSSKERDHKGERFKSVKQMHDGQSRLLESQENYIV